MADKMRCSICQSKTEEIRHLSIYANGSEGVFACTPCVLAITEFVRELQSAAGRASMTAFKEQRELLKEKQNG